MNKKVVIISAVVLAILIFVGYNVVSRHSQNNASTNQMKTVTAKRGTVNSSFTATGIIVSANQVDLNFENSGTLEDLKVALNEKVEDGQDLAVLDPANSMLADETLESPMDGTVIHIGAKEGELLSSTGNTASANSTSSAGTIETSGLITIANLNDLQTEMSIDQSDIAKVSNGQKVKITLDAIEDEVFDGKVVSIDPVPTNDQNVITYTAYASIEKSKPSLRLGMSAEVELDYGKKENVIVVPNDAVRNRDGRTIVITLVNGRPRPIEVKTGLADDKNTEITSGLSDGEEIILGDFNINQTPSGGRRFFGGSRGGGGGMFGH